MVNILASSLASLFYDIFGVEGIFYSTLITTVVIVIFAEVLPKTYALKPTRTALLISPIIFYLNKSLYLIILVINQIVRLIFKKDTDKRIVDQQSEEELRSYRFI